MTLVGRLVGSGWTDDERFCDVSDTVDTSTDETTMELLGDEPKEEDNNI